MKSGFRSCENKGFQLVFENGWMVSVQFGPGNYCEHLMAGLDDFRAPKKTEIWEAEEAEIAAIHKDGYWYDFGMDTVKGYCKVAEVIEFINKIASITPEQIESGEISVREPYKFEETEETEESED